MARKWRTFVDTAPFSTSPAVPSFNYVKVTLNYALHMNYAHLVSLLSFIKMVLGVQEDDYTWWYVRKFTLRDWCSNHITWVTLSWCWNQGMSHGMAMSYSTTSPQAWRSRLMLRPLSKQIWHIVHIKPSETDAKSVEAMGAPSKSSMLWSCSDGC